MQITARQAETPQAGQRVAVIGNIEDDFHALGRRMSAPPCVRTDGLFTIWAMTCCRPYSWDKAIEVGARVIGASAMMLTTARNIRKLREEIDRRGLTGRIQLAVGGATFLISSGSGGGSGRRRHCSERPRVGRLVRPALGTIGLPRRARYERHRTHPGDSRGPGGRSPGGGTDTQSVRGRGSQGARSIGTTAIRRPMPKGRRLSGRPSCRIVSVHRSILQDWGPRSAAKSGYSRKRPRMSRGRRFSR